METEIIKFKNLKKKFECLKDIEKPIPQQAISQHIWI